MANTNISAHTQETLYKRFLKLCLFLIFFLSAFYMTFFGIGLLLVVSVPDLIRISFISLPFLLFGVSLLRVLLFARQSQRLDKKSGSLPTVIPEKVDNQRRLFLKTLGSLGLVGLIYFLLTKKTQALQFGGTGIPDPIGIEPLGNSQTTGSVTLTNANTWYQVPPTNQTNRVFLVLHNRSGYDMYWSFDNTVSASTGGLLFPSGGTLQFDAGSAVNVYVRCATAGQVCWYAESQSQ